MKHRILEISSDFGSPKYVVQKKTWWHFKWFQVGIPYSFLSDAVNKIKRRESVTSRVLKKKEWVK